MSTKTFSKHTPLATLILAALLSLPALARADVYKCPDASGTPLYQNRPCEGADEPAIISPGPGSQYMGAALPLRPQAEPPHVHHEKPVSVSPAAGGPVDTRTFGMLEIGSSEREVLAKLGQPDRVVPGPPTMVLNRWSSGRREWREKVRSAWVYESDGYSMRTVLYFEDGQLVQKEKGR